MRLVLCNCPSEMADKIGREVVEKGLAVCVNAVPEVQRISLQEEEVVVQKETILMIQTLKNRIENLIETLVEIHPYATPAIISLSIFEGSRDYLDWVEDKLDKG